MHIFLLRWRILVHDKMHIADSSVGFYFVPFYVYPCFKDQKTNIIWKKNVNEHNLEISKYLNGNEKNSIHFWIYSWSNMTIWVLAQTFSILIKRFSNQTYPNSINSIFDELSESLVCLVGALTKSSSVSKIRALDQIPMLVTISCINPARLINFLLVTVVRRFFNRKVFKFNSNLLI